MQGKSINGFVLKQFIGQGGMGEVWLAENGLGKKAAVKVLLNTNADEKQLIRFKNEAKIMVQLDHPNIRQVYDYGLIGGKPCIIMEYLEGNDLDSLMKQGRRFSDNELKLWWNQTVRALIYVHGKGFVHRDLKPANLFLDKNGDIKLLDFGISKDPNSGLTGSTTTMGTFPFMSPEQIVAMKDVDYRSDFYSLAVTFVNLLTGKMPYYGLGAFSIMTKILQEPLDLSGVPLQWCSFLKPYLEKEPSRRSYLHEFEIIGDVSNCISTQKDLEFYVKGVRFVMKFVEGGTFWMGAQKDSLYGQNYDRDAFDEEKPVHKVMLKSFHIGETVVTQALWKAVMGNNPSFYFDDNMPVNEVNWYDCQQFIVNLNNYTNRNFRLPTEAEWEYAARGGKKSNGFRYAGSNILDEVGWYNGNRNYHRVRPVKAKKANELGLYDMSGNVHEWCQDWFGKYVNEFQVNPIGAIKGDSRVVRGGCWVFDAKICRVSDRLFRGYSPDTRKDSIGFRLCL